MFELSNYNIPREISHLSSFCFAYTTALYYYVLTSISYCTHARAITDNIDHGKIGLPKQRSRAQPETVQG